MEAGENTSPKTDGRPRSIIFYVVFAAALYAVIQAHALLSPILLSFLLIILITLAVNPIIQRLKAWTGGRTRSTVLVVAALITFGGLVVWAAVVPLKQAGLTLSERSMDWHTTQPSFSLFCLPSFLG